MAITLVLSACSLIDDLGKPEEIEMEAVNNQVEELYFSNLSSFPKEKGQALSDKKNDIYWLWANGFPVRNEEYFSADGLVFANYNANSDQITVANILSKGATVKETTLEEDLYVSWVYDFTNGELQDLVQVNVDEEPRDLIPFTEEEWADFSNGYKESLVRISR